MKPFINQHRILTQFLEYLVSGGIYFWVGYAAFALLWSGLGWSLWWATVTSNFVGWTVNYLMQRYWVFRQDGLNRHKTEMRSRYIFITLVDFGLNYFILYTLRKAGITPYIGQFVSAAFFTIWNYLWYRFWVFPDKYSPGFKPNISLSRMLIHIPHGHSSYSK